MALELRSKERNVGKDGERKVEGREYEEKEKERSREERKNQSAYMGKKERRGESVRRSHRALTPRGFSGDN